MVDNKEVVKLAVDAYKNRVAGNFSQSDAMEVLRQELIARNNGSEKLNPAEIRDGLCPGLFAILTEIIQKTAIEGLTGDEFFMNFVEFRNLALGDKNEFKIKDNTLFVVSDVAAGYQALRRQRVHGEETISIPTKIEGIKMYEETDLVLSGRIDLNEFIDRVGVSIRKHYYNKIYLAWSGITATELGATYFPAAGSYSEDALLDVISHVEAATGKAVTLVGTKKAIRKLGTAVVSEAAKQDLYDIGYYGKFNGTPVVAVAQRHEIGTTNFLFDDTVIYVVPTGMKPIKFVTEGNDQLFLSDPTANQDLSTEYLYLTKTGVGLVLEETFGVYDMA